MRPERISQMVAEMHTNIDHKRVAGYLNEISADEHFAYALERLLVGIDAELRHST